MRLSRALLAAAVVALAAAPAGAADPAKRLLLVTHSAGFIHDSVGVAEDVLKQLGPKHGFEVTCYRWTNEPTGPGFEKYAKEFRARTGKTVEAENCGRVNKETLKNFDAVLFFTTGNPTTPDETRELVEWVKAGGAFAGTHCATDTLYQAPAYGSLVGGYFDGHPWHQKIKLHVEDPKHPAAAGFTDGAEITDEIYQFKTDVYSRDKLHVILSVDNASIDVGKGKRADKDYAVSWCHDVGKGRSFYTSLGHRKEVWKDERFQTHLLGGLNWAVGRAAGDATPSGKK